MPFHSTTQHDGHQVTIYHLGEPPTLPPWLPSLSLPALPALPGREDLALDFDGHRAAYAAARQAVEVWEAERATANDRRHAEAGDAAAVEVRRAHLAAGLAALEALRAAAELLLPELAASAEALRNMIDNTPPAQLVPRIHKRLADVDGALSVLTCVARGLTENRATPLREALNRLGPPGPEVTHTPIGRSPGHID